MYGLSADLLSNIKHLMAQHLGIDEAWLFGSRATGNFRPGSDIDMAIKGDKLTLNDIITLSIAFDDLETPYRFDLILYHRINEPALQEHIDRAGKLLYQKTASPIPH